MKVKDFIKEISADFYAGVPDSQLKALCNWLIDTYGNDPTHHVIAANEGNAAALAAGYHLATGKVPVVYMQNSGEGNIINPLASLLSTDVYAIPCVFVIGWRGEPGVHDEPQHVQQGKVTLGLMEVMGVPTFVIDKETTETELAEAMDGFRAELAEGRSVAFVVRKGALEYDGSPEYKNDNPMLREDIVRHIVAVSGDDPIVSTTGKTSRELFEVREARGEDHSRDFLTVGSMGHASSIALGMALQKPGQRVWCVEGDGAVEMHMGALAVIGKVQPGNLVHVVINNAAHESVGGQPTAMGGVDLVAIAKAVGYPNATSVATPEELDAALHDAVSHGGPTFIEAKSAIGSRPDLGRPTTTPQQNKRVFMDHLQRQ